MLFFFFFNDTATTEIYTLSLHDALPISADVQRDHNGAHSMAAEVDGHPLRHIGRPEQDAVARAHAASLQLARDAAAQPVRSEEHTSELQSQSNLVCRLLLEKKNKTHNKS